MNIKFCAVAALTMAASVSLNATVLIVTSPADSGAGTLRDMVAASAAGDTIQFAVGGVIALSSAITIPHTLSVLGPGPASLTIDAGHLDRAFVVSSGSVVIFGMTIINGLAAGPNGPDGAVPSQNGGPGLDGDGGAILCSASSVSLSLSNCWFAANTAQGGNGGKGWDNPPASAFTPGNGGNGGQGLGGAVYTPGTAIIAYCTFSQNLAIGGNGGAGGTNGSFDSLTGGTGGGGGNAAGGAVWEANNLVPLDFTNVTCSGNVAAGGAGGAGGNSLGGPGGNGGDSSGGIGGGIDTYIALFACDTIISNSATGGTAGAAGNGFPPGSAGTVGLALGGGVYGYAVNCLSIFKNTILADNFSSGALSNFFIGIKDEGYNYFGTDDIDLNCGAPLSLGTQVGTVAMPLHPQLGPLAQNGGGLPTHAVRLTSPVLDAGNSFGTANDERGATRPYDFPFVPNAPGGDGSDIGAFELGSADLGASLSSNALVVSWPAAYGDFVLQSTTNLQSPGSWTTVARPYFVVSNQFMVANPTTNGSMFFRLLNQSGAQ